MGAPVEQDDETLGGEPEHVVVTELQEFHFYALAGGDVEEAAGVGRGEFLPEHDPPRRVEPAVQSAVPVRVRATLTPQPADGMDSVMSPAGPSPRFVQSLLQEGLYVRSCLRLNDVRAQQRLVLWAAMEQAFR